jgi:hypothetical protein
MSQACQEGYSEKDRVTQMLKENYDLTSKLLISAEEIEKMNNFHRVKLQESLREKHEMEKYIE